jgi:hypothetical protein
MLNIRDMVQSENSTYSVYCKCFHNLHVMWRLRMSGAVPLLPLYAFMAWTGTTLPCFIFTVCALAFFSFQRLMHVELLGAGNHIVFNLTFSAHTSTCYPVPRVFSRCTNMTLPRYLLPMSARHIIRKMTQMFNIIHPSRECTLSLQ